MNKKCSDRDGISAFERKDGRYEARALDTRRFGSDGKRKYKSFYGATKGGNGQSHRLPLRSQTGLLLR